MPVGVPGKSYPFRSSVLCSGQKDRPEEASQQGPSDRADASGNWFSGFARMGDVLMKLMRNGSAVPEPDTPPVEQTLIPDLSEELDARYEELHQEMKTDEKVKERVRTLQMSVSRMLPCPPWVTVVQMPAIAAEGRGVLQMRLYIPSGAQTRVEFPKGSGKMYINPHIIQLPGPALNRKERMAARFQEKFGIPFPQLDEDVCTVPPCDSPAALLALQAPATAEAELTACRNRRRGTSSTCSLRSHTNIRSSACWPQQA